MADKARAKTTRIQKQQKSFQPENEDPSFSTNLLFREIGRKLAVLDPNKTMSKTLAFDRLWKELKAGQLTAGFFIKSRWIEIPTSFWQGLDSDRTKDLLTHKKGKLKLYLSELTDVITDAVIADGTVTLDPSELRILIGSSKRGVEPEIPLKSWSTFLERNELVDRPAHQKASKTRGGNTQSEKWRDIAEFFLGYCIARPIPASATALQHDMLAVIQRMKLTTEGWPGASSWRDVIKAGRTLARKIEQAYPKA